MRLITSRGSRIVRTWLPLSMTLLAACRSHPSAEVPALPPRPWDHITPPLLRHTAVEGRGSLERYCSTRENDAWEHRARAQEGDLLGIWAMTLALTHRNPGERNFVVYLAQVFFIRDYAIPQTTLHQEALRAIELYRAHPGFSWDIWRRARDHETSTTSVQFRRAAEDCWFGPVNLDLGPWVRQLESRKPYDAEIAFQVLLRLLQKHHAKLFQIMAESPKIRFPTSESAQVYWTMLHFCERGERRRWIDLQSANPEQLRFEILTLPTFFNRYVDRGYRPFFAGVLTRLTELTSHDAPSIRAAALEALARLPTANLQEIDRVFGSRR